MRRMVQGIFDRYGTDAYLCHEEEWKKIKVFFQSVHSKSWQNMRGEGHPLGVLPRGMYICLMPAGTASEVGDRLTVMGTEYRVCRVEDMPIVPNPVYRWALCTGKGSEEIWGQVNG